MLTIRRIFITPIICVIAAWIVGMLPSSARSQQSQELAPVKVEASPYGEQLAPVKVGANPYGEQLVGPYNQPRWSARGRFSANTDVYVLLPFRFTSILIITERFRGWVNQTTSSLKNSS